MTEWVPTSVAFVLVMVYLAGYLLLLEVDWLEYGPVEKSLLRRGGAAAIVLLVIALAWPFLLLYGLIVVLRS